MWLRHALFLPPYPEPDGETIIAVQTRTGVQGRLRRPGIPGAESKARAIRHGLRSP